MARRRLRRLVTRRRVKWVGASVALGWVLATTVALACAIWSDTSSQPVTRDVQDRFVIERRGWGLVQLRTNSLRPDKTDWMIYSTIMAGFPFSMYKRSVSRLEPPGVHYLEGALARPPASVTEGLLISNDGRVLRINTRYRRVIVPVIPIAFGSIANSVLYGGVILVICTLLMRIRSTPKPGHCRHCRYDLTGIDGAICPECGTPTGREA